MNESTPIFPTPKTNRGKAVLFLFLFISTLIIGIALLYVGILGYIVYDETMYEGICEVNNYKLTFYESDPDYHEDVYKLIFNVTVIDDSEHLINPDCCYSAIVYKNEYVSYSTAEDLIKKYSYGTNTSCLYRDKNIKYPELGDASNEIWIEGKSNVSSRTGLILIIFGSMIFCLPYIICTICLLYIKSKTKNNTRSHIALNL